MERLRAVFVILILISFAPLQATTVRPLTLGDLVAKAWSMCGEPGKWDVQDVLTHAIGHFLGMDHSALLSSVMAPYGAPERLDQRTLTYDDVAAVTEIYPNFPNRTRGLRSCRLARQESV